jgi:N-acetylglucosamine kinase-like BadF-type ATPase
MSFYLAIDAGGTKADYALVDESKILARVRSGTIKRMRVDAETAAKNINEAMHELGSLSGVDLRSVVRTCVGTAGETVPLVTDWLRQEISARVGGELLILGDVEIALDAAFPGQPGILVLAGTGSNVAGRTPDSQVFTAGGWGPVLADQGSGHRIGYEALRALFLAIDRGAETVLLPAVLKFWEPSSVPDLVAFANAVPSPDFSQLVRLVTDSAEQGDAVAQSVLHQQGWELAQLVILLLGRMQKHLNDEGFVPRLAFAGSILEKVHPVRDALLETVNGRYPKLEAIDGVIDPLNGAIWRARTGFATTGGK